MDFGGKTSSAGQDPFEMFGTPRDAGGGGRWKVESFAVRLEGGNLMVILLMVLKSGVHQLRLVLYPMIYSVSYIPGDARFKPSTVLLMVRSKSGGYRLHPQSLTASLPLKNGGTGRRSIPIGKVTFQGRAVKLREGNR